MSNLHYDDNDLRSMKEKMIEKRFGGTPPVQKGRRIVKRISSNSIDRKLANAVGKMIPLKDLMEINIFMGNGDCIHITNPKCFVNQMSKCFIVRGDEFTKPIEYYLPDIQNQMSGSELHTSIIRKFLDGKNKKSNNNDDDDDEDDDDDDDDDDGPPDLVDELNFEKVANETKDEAKDDGGDDDDDDDDDDVPPLFDLESNETIKKR